MSASSPSHPTEPSTAAASIRATGYQISGHLRDLVGRLDDARRRAERLSASAASALRAATGDLEHVAVCIEAAVEALEAEYRPRPARRRSVTDLVAGGDELPAPGATALACLVEALDGDDLRGWQADEARMALAWLLLRDDLASAAVTALLDALDEPVQPGDLFAAARRRP